MSQNLDNELISLYLKAFKNLNCRVIIGCNKKELPKNNNFFYCDSINQHQLFPKMKLIIQCGGLGTVFKAAYHGIPQLIIPKNFEEPFWGEKIKELGIGESISFYELSSEKLKNSVNRILNSKNIYYNCELLSNYIDINGAKNIYDFICNSI